MRLTEEQYRDLMARRGLAAGSSGEPSTKSTKSARPKYLNQPTASADGIVHDAKGECERWEELRLLERAGAIRSLRRQVPFAMVVNGIHICTYVADFDYLEGEARIVEDRKSPRTRQLAAFRIKAKLMQAIHGIQVREV
jgi:hypothetical protein